MTPFDANQDEDVINATHNQKLVGVEEVAAFLGVPKSWVYERTRRRGNECLPHLKVGKYLRFRLSDVETYLETLRRA